MRYRWNVGSLAWLSHRLTGVALTLYIFVHLYVLSHLRDPEEFAAMMGLFNNPAMKAAELGLLALVAAHGLNGIRLMLIDLGVPTRFQKALLAAAVLAGLIIVIAGAGPFIGGGTH